MNHQNFERTLHFRDIPGSMLVGVSAHQPSPRKCAKALERRWNLSFESAERKRGSLVPLLFASAARSPKSRPASIHNHFAKSTLRLSRRFSSNSALNEHKQPTCGCGTCRSAASCQIISLKGAYVLTSASEKARLKKRVFSGTPNPRLDQAPRGS